MRWPIATLFFVLSHNNNALVNGGWVDEDTPEEKRVTKSLIDGTEYKLVRQIK